MHPAREGITGALLTPSSLAVIVSTLPERERRPAIGTWTPTETIAGALRRAELERRLAPADLRDQPALVLDRLRLIAKAVLTSSRNSGEPKVDGAGARPCGLGLGGSVQARTFSYLRAAAPRVNEPIQRDPLFEECFPIAVEVDRIRQIAKNRLNLCGEIAGSA
jgi:hypothetical protein